VFIRGSFRVFCVFRGFEFGSRREQASNIEMENPDQSAAARQHRPAITKIER
jgi:hypothetical protein